MLNDKSYACSQRTRDSSKALIFFSPCGAVTGSAADEEDAGSTLKEEMWMRDSEMYKLVIIDKTLK